MLLFRRERLKSDTDWKPPASAQRIMICLSMGLDLSILTDKISVPLLARFDKGF